MEVKRKINHSGCMARDDPYFHLRVPPDLHAKIVEAAKASGRSQNAELVVRL
jgi:predicted HicB family RNase H-like nuclease